MQIHDTLLKPIVTEKAAMAQEDNVYVFQVGMAANKLDVKNAIEQFFGVEVDKVRTLVVRGKIKRFGRHHGRRSDWKKAYVTLRDGHSINFWGEDGEA